MGSNDIKQTTGTVLSIERCSLHDGPGLRTTVFLKGCPLSCIFCHNPESQSFKPELYFLNERCTCCGLCVSVCNNHKIIKIAENDKYTENTEHIIDRKDCIACGKCADGCPQSAIEIKGTLMSIREVMDVVVRDRVYYEKSSGGLTLSGGEPLSQLGFTLEMLKLAKENDIDTCIETSGYSPTGNILSITPYVDLFLFDFKESDENRYRDFIGGDRDLIFENLFAVDKTGAKIILRCPIIPGCNDREDHFNAIAETANKLGNIIEVNIMPYHPMGTSKSKRIGREPTLSGVGFPEDELINKWIEMVGSKTSVRVIKG